MKKWSILIAFLLLITQSTFAEETPWTNSNWIPVESSPKVKIIQNGNKINVKTLNKPAQTTINSKESQAKQNIRGTKDNLIVKKGNFKILSSDPYMVKINGKKYYLVRDRNNDKYFIKDILGCNDSKVVLFEDLKSLNIDKNSKITRDELKKANIRFVAVVNNKLQLYDKTLDYNLDNIEYIDLNSLRGTINKGQIGSFGYFDMYIRDNDGLSKKIIGIVTFDNNETLEELISQ